MIFSPFSHFVVQFSIPVKRRNKWICALKTSLAELKIFGPSGDPGAEKPPKAYTQIPWDEVKRMEEEKKRREAGRQSFVKTEYDLADRTAVASELLIPQPYDEVLTHSFK